MNQWQGLGFSSQFVFSLLPIHFSFLYAIIISCSIWFFVQLLEVKYFAQLLIHFSEFFLYYYFFMQFLLIKFYSEPYHLYKVIRMNCHSHIFFTRSLVKCDTKILYFSKNGYICRNYQLRIYF